MQQLVSISLLFGVLLPAAVLPVSAQEQANAPAEMLIDAAAPRWRVDRFAGNSTAGSNALQGPARQVGGITRCAVAPAPDGSVFLATGRKWAHDRIVRVAPDGQLRLIAGGGSSLADGPASRARILVATRGNSFVYSPSDASLYFVHAMIPAVRRLYRQDGRWLVETVAGDPNKPGHANGPADEALLTEPMSIAVTSTGTIYLLDDRTHLRKIEGGQVTTLANFPGGPDEHRFRWLKDGAIKTVIGRRGNRRCPLDSLGTAADAVQMV